LNAQFRNWMDKSVFYLYTKCKKRVYDKSGYFTNFKIGHQSWF
jgi:hypothetical protein